MAGTGTGIRRHRLFFLGFKRKEGGEASTAGAVTDGQHSGWRRLRPWGRGARRAAVATSAAADLPSAGQAVAATPDDDDNDAGWMDSYYGSQIGGAAAAQLPPPLPARLQAPAGEPVGEPAPLPVPRKASSVWLSVAAEPGTPRSASGGAATEGDEAGEGADVAAERARVEALWQQW